MTLTGRLASRARLYQTVRSAHLERFRQLAPATILYSGIRYDFDSALVGDLDLVPAGAIRAAWLLARSEVRQLEINEPLMITSLRHTALAVAAVRLRALAGRGRTELLSYAIENANPFAAAPVGGRARLRRAEHRLLSGYIWRNLDRVVFGTDAARRTYAAAFPARTVAETLVIPALPAPCACPPGGDRGRGSQVLFLGALTDRKGFPLVLAAWPLLKVALPDARLTIVGTGRLAAQARAAAEADGSIELVIDPPREDVHARLRRSRVLVLPSQPAPGWREQVGLPICEGLAHGCAIVTSTETGLADWLARHGHVVVPPGGSAEALAGALADALRQDRDAGSVLADLPDADGRLVADAWLFRER